MRPPSEEWFQILAPDMRGLSQRRFKVLIWALSSFNDMELDEQQVVDSLQKLHQESTITAETNSWGPTSRRSGNPRIDGGEPMIMCCSIRR